MDPERMKRGVAAVFTRAAENYDQLGVDFFTPMGRDLVAIAGLKAGDRVLDVGCGRGASLFAAADVVGPEGAVTGIDLSPGMVERARAEAAQRNLAGVTVLEGDAEDPQFDAGSFDAVLAGLVLFFLPDLGKALHRYATLLAPGGRLAFTTFGTQDPHFDAAMRAIGEYVPGGVPPRDQRQGQLGSPEGIVATLAEQGFPGASVTARSYESRFVDIDHFLRWAWSHGARFVLEQIPEMELPAATAAAQAALAPARTPEGDLRFLTEVRFTVASAAH